MGEYQHVQPGAAYGKIVRRRVPGAAGAVSAAVHQRRPPRRQQRGGRALAHVQGGDCQTGALRLQPSQPDGGAQRKGQRQRRNQGPLWPLLSHSRRQKGQIRPRQPDHAVRVVRPQRGEGELPQQQDHPPGVPAQQSGGSPQDSGRTGEEHRQRPQRQGAHHQQRQRPQRQHGGQGRQNQDLPEVQGDEGDGEQHRPQGGGHAGERHPPRLPQQKLSPRPLGRALVPEGTVHPAKQGFRRQLDARHRREGQLQAHAGRGKGVLDQQHQQRRPQGGRPVPFPPRQGRGQQGALHDHRPEGRRGSPSHQGVKQQQRGHGQGGFPIVPAQQQPQPHQEGDVEPGHHQPVHQPRPVKGGIERPVQPGFVPQGDGGGDGGGGFVKGGINAVPKPAGAQSRPVAQGNPSGGLNVRIPAAIRQQVYPLGGIVGGLVSVGAVGQPHPGGAGEPVPRLQPAPVLRAVGQGVRREKAAVQADGDGIPADGGGHGIGSHLPGQGHILPHPALRRGPEQGEVRPGPSQRQHPAQAKGHRPPGALPADIPGQRPFVPAPAQRDRALPSPGPGAHPYRQRRPQQGGSRQKRRSAGLKIARPQAGGGEAPGKPGQFPHTAAPFPNAFSPILSAMGGQVNAAGEICGGTCQTCPGLICWENRQRS